MGTLACHFEYPKDAKEKVQIKSMLKSHISFQNFGSLEKNKTIE